MKKLLCMLLTVVLLFSVCSVGTVASGSVLGDVSADNQVDAKDALLVLKYAVGKAALTDAQKAVGDINGDGDLNAKDALMILQIAVDGYTEITFGTILAEEYAADTDIGLLWQQTLENAQQAGVYTTVVKTDSNSLVENVANGQNMGDVLEVSLGTARALARQGLLCDLSDVVENAPVYDSALTKAMTFGDRTYGVMIPSRGANVMGVIYNKELVAQYATATDVEALYRNNQWDFEAFRQLALACTQDVNGDKKTDVYGFTSNTHIIDMAIDASMGGTCLKLGESVEATFAASEASMTTQKWLQSLRENDKSWNYKADINTCVAEFAAGKAAMFVSYASYARQIGQTADFEMGFVPMPIGFAQETYVNATYDGTVYVVPKANANKLPQITKWLNQMAKAEDDYLQLEQKAFAGYGFDEASVDAYTYLIQNQTPEFSTGALSLDTIHKIAEHITSKCSCPPGKRYWTALYEQAQKECDDFYEPLYNMK